MLMTVSDKDNKQNRKQFHEIEEIKLIIDAIHAVHMWKGEHISYVNKQKTQ